MIAAVNPDPQLRELFADRGDAAQAGAPALQILSQVFTDAKNDPQNAGKPVEKWKTRPLSTQEQAVVDKGMSRNQPAAESSSLSDLGFVPEAPPSQSASAPAKKQSYQAPPTATQQKQSPTASARQYIDDLGFQPVGVSAGPGIQAAPPEGWLQRLKETVLGGPRVGDTPVGRALGLSYEAPTEQHVPTTSLPLVRPTALSPGAPESVAGGVGKGALEFGEGMTTAPNLLMMAGSGGLGVLGKVSSYLPRAVSAAFSLDMLKNAYDQLPEVKAAINRGDWPGAAKAITKAALTAGMGVAAGTHAVRGEASSFSPSNEEANPEPSPADKAVQSARAGADALDDLGFHPEGDQAADEPARRVTGSSNVPLNDNGRAQSKELAQRTAGQFDRINSSPMDRARETAQIVGSANPQAPVQVTEGLGPWKLGEHEAQPADQERAAIDQRITDTPDEAAPGRGPQSTDDGEASTQRRIASSEKSSARSSTLSQAKAR